MARTGIMLSILLLAALQTSPTLEQQLQEQLDTWVESGATPGACLAVSYDDGRLLEFASGMSDVEQQIPMTVDHRLMSGSIGKTYFAALFMDLVEEGRLAPDDLLSKHLGEEEWFSRLPNAKTVTLHQLMNHTSGIPEHVHLEKFWQDARADVQKVWLPEDLVAYILDADPHFEAGSDWSYADTNFVLAGMAMEKVMGRSVYREVHRRYLQPLNLHETLATSSNDLPGLSQGYHILGERDRAEPLPVLHEGKMELNPQLEWCGGGYYSTTSDLAAWGRDLFTGKAASLSQVKDSIAHAVDAKLAPGDRYAYGVIVSETPYGAGWGHQGWFPGYLSELMYFPEQGFSIAVQANTDNVRATGPLRRQVFAAAELLSDA